MHDESSKITVIPWWTYDITEDVTPERLFWITGGLGSGKTTGGAMWFIDRWLLNKDSMFSWGVAPTYTKVEQIMIPALIQVLDELYNMRDGVDFKITRSPFWKVRLKNYRHELHLLSGDRPELFVGSNIATWWITEPGLQSRQVYEKCQTRLRCPKAVIRQGLGEGTPEGYNWYQEVADIPGSGYDRTDEEKNMRRIIVETTMNKHLMPSPEIYAKTKIRDVYAYDRNKAISYEKGLFTKFTKGSAYWEFIESRNVIGNDDVQPSPFLPLALSFDFNISPLSYIVAQEFTSQKGFYAPVIRKHIVLEEGSGECRGLMDAIAEFAFKFPPHVWGNVPIHVYGDASGFARNLFREGDNYTAIEEYLRGLGYRNIVIKAVRSNPPQQHRLEKTAAMMAYERFAVKSKCQKLIQSFIKTSLVPGTWDIDKKGQDQHTHWADAATYYLYEEAKDLNLANPRARRVIGTS
ncbi:MAG: hypothetical protein E6R03_09255 [Hyphomicrobiaceae bacterium]|nr:MAG: hypothetical protein E6R03_09255 [Hyphomicrobiaceae bacterium]